MRPLILDFAEPALPGNTDTSQIEYNPELQLSVIKGTKIPAFDCVQGKVKTFTRAGNEPTDVAGSLTSIMATHTYTANTSTEISDSDESIPELSGVLATKTMTFTSTEVTDDDDSTMSKYIMGTMTGTKTYREETDSDN